MYRGIIILVHVVCLYIQFSSQNVIPNNTELDNKISKMWAEVEIYKQKIYYSNLNGTKLATGLVNEMVSIESNMIRRLNEHFNNIEKEARLTGKLDNVLIDSFYYELLHEEIKNSQFFPLIKEEVKSATNDTKVRKLFIELIVKAENVFNEASQELILEMKTNPRQIFIMQTEEEALQFENKYKSIRDKYLNKIKYESIKTLEELRKIGKAYEFEVFANRFKGDLPNARPISSHEHP